MKLNFIKNIAPAALLSLSFGVSSCVNDLDLSVQDDQTNTEFDQTAYLAKVYASLVQTGSQGPDGGADMAQFDEGNSSFYRRVFEANELPTDETMWTWQGDAGIPELTNISWNSAHGYNELTYYRIEFNVTLCNFFLDQTEGATDAETLQQRAEVRFLRAYFNTQFIDLYGKVPFKEHFNTDLPTEMSRANAFNYVVNELKAVAGETESNEVLGDAGTVDYGRADKAAAWMLLARLYLNAEVYTGTPQWENAKTYADKVINESGYKLNETELNGYTAYEQLFMGDNGENANARQEIIFAIRCDGAATQNWSGSEYTIGSTRGNGTPDAGTTEAWTCNRARQAMVAKFFDDLSTVPLTQDPMEIRTAANDDRAMFYGGGEMVEGELTNQRTVETETKMSFTAGLGILKWTNIYATGGRPHDTKFPDTDVPLFRVAEAYLTRAEANYRIGSNAVDVLKDLNKIRSRAHAADLQDVDERTLLDEWCREFYFEGRRRSDLVRFNCFTTGNYLWDWKGGTYEGNAVNSFYNVYPIPYAELSTNNNMTQNPGY
ncbi:MAG: RagB/SusD family nutrient uptake outer membrane protein [Alloprevotella sp.]|nr:RagB/SusD family nutrient uptake outer membrane protein [Alloprevotella sp.]